MKAMIWAAGLGTRLRPLTETIPKAMVPVLNRPITEYNLELCAQAGITEIIINLHYFPETIKNYFGKDYKGIEISYSYEKELLENAGAIKKVAPFFEETFLCIASDNLVDLNISKMFKFHKKKKALVTIATYKAKDVSKYGIVQTNKNNRILSFQEKPKPEEALGDQIATCLYIFEPQILNYIPKGEKCHFGKDIFPLLLEKGEKLFAFPHKGYWNDVGNSKNYMQANFDMLNLIKRSPFKELDKKEKWQTKKNHVILGTDTYIDPQVKINNSIIWNDTEVKGESYIENCIIADQCLIKNSKLNNMVVGQRNTVEEASHLNDNNDLVKIWPGNSLTGKIKKDIKN